MRTCADTAETSSPSGSTAAAVAKGLQCDEDRNVIGNNCPEIATSDIEELLHYFAKNPYTSSKANDPEIVKFMETCKKFFEVDYDIDTIRNVNGDLCGHYPPDIYIIKNEKNKVPEVENNGNVPGNNAGTSQQTNEEVDLTTACNQAKYARCRSRFTVPVIWYKGKNICRSATLATFYEIVGRAGYDAYFRSDDSNTNRIQDNPIFPQDESTTTFNWEVFDTTRGNDIKLLQKLQVDTIFDLMVEKKKIKYTFSVSSSEKVDQKNRYRDFKIVSLPYPGCEFFKCFKENNCSGENLRFDFNQEMCDTELNIPDNAHVDGLSINFSAYKQWDLNEITQNYIKYILHYLKENRQGILIHCISGWDRTPLFISLIRILLWADNLIHTSLNANQMLYFTIAYDWLLFGHRLSERVGNGEEIFMFCFYALKFFFSEDYSIAWEDYVPKTSLSPERETDGQSPLKDFQQLLKKRDSSSPEQDDFMETASPRLPRGLSSPNKFSNGSSSSSSNGLNSKRSPPVNVPKTRTSSEDSNASWLSTSWQVVSTTGSFKDSDSRSSKSSFETDFLTIRRQKLNAIRNKFYSCYYQTEIGRAHV